MLLLIYVETLLVSIGQRELQVVHELWVEASSRTQLGSIFSSRRRRTVEFIPEVRVFLLVMGDFVSFRPSLESFVVAALLVDLEVGPRATIEFSQS